ncbi:putative AbiEi antitoxin of type IV toxin-antitoxin system [Kribbella rubisoli]|uniref:AbiEi antitoxin of type IV toxin-antitoxin system n=1 Tax=Kribbella rubisoli TaxID=3075929 RepID=A0A4Q7X0G0_9ACTN|nr:putative AbiEi antitoxin of type IV toxin-antitoxin system [Kribbella rubisoli]
MAPVDQPRARQRLAMLPPTFTTAQALRAGVPSRDLATLVSEGAALELSRGVYRRSDAPETAHLDLLAVHTRASHTVVCGESVLALHDLIDDIPGLLYTSPYRAELAVRRSPTRPSSSRSTRPRPSISTSSSTRRHQASSYRSTTQPAAWSMPCATATASVRHWPWRRSADTCEPVGPTGPGICKASHANCTRCPSSGRPSKRCSPDGQSSPRHTAGRVYLRPSCTSPCRTAADGDFAQSLSTRNSAT